MKITAVLMSIMFFSGFSKAPDNPVRANMPIISFEGNTQGTTYHIKYRDGKQRQLKRQIDSILTTIDQCLSTYRPDSEISEFNRAALGQSQRFQFRLPYFYPVLYRSKAVYDATDGAFDPTVAPLVEVFRRRKRQPTAPPENIDSLLQFVGFRYIDFDSVSVRKSKDNIRLDFDGIAQGYTVDVLTAYLDALSIQNYLVEIGGEVRCRGKKGEEQAWTLGIENPLRPGELQATVGLVDRAMATSGNYRNHYQQGGRTYNHIINPKTGFSEQDSLLSVTVFAPDAATADAYATAFVVMGVEQTKRFVMAQPLLDVYLIYQRATGDSGIFFSEGIKNYIKR